MALAVPDSNDSREERGVNCGGVKALYDRCFDSWFRDDFLRGNFNDRCKAELREYRRCLKGLFESRGNRKLVELIKRFE